MNTLCRLAETGSEPLALHGLVTVTCRFFYPNVHEDKERPHHCELVNAPFAAACFASNAPSIRWRRKKSVITPGALHERSVMGVLSSSI